MKKLKLLIITSKFPRFEGDPQPPFTYDFAKQLVKKGYKVYILAPGDAKAKRYETFDGMKVYRFNYFFPTSLQKFAYGAGIPANLRNSFLAKVQALPFILSEIVSTRKLVRKINPDIIHAHWGFPQGLAALLSGKPYIVSIFGGEVFLAKRYHMISALDKILKRSKQSFVITNGLKKIMNEFGIKSEVTVVPFGIDIERIHPNFNGYAEIRKKFCKKDELMVLNVGRLVEKKGHTYLLDAFSKVVKKIPKCKLIIVGDGPLYDQLNQQAGKLNIADKVVFTKNIYHEDLPKYYCAADLFVQPSIIDRTGNRETQGVVFLEAMACKCPCIGTNTGGIPDVIIHKKTGLLVPQCDSEALAKAIQTVLTDVSLRKSIIKNGYLRVKKVFSWPNIVEKYEECYQKYSTSKKHNKYK